jgi:prophage regulatory protein
MDSRETSAVTNKLIRFADVLQRVAMRRSFLFAAIKNGTFPRPIKHGRTTLFVDAEIEAWIRARIADRDGFGCAPRLLVTERELATSLGISVSWLQKDRAKRQLIPFVKIGDRVRYDLEEARQALKASSFGGKRTVDASERGSAT